MFSGGTTKAGIENAKGIIDNKDQKTADSICDLISTLTSYILGDQFPKSANLPTASCSVKSFLVVIENAKKDLSNNGGKIKDTTYMSILSTMSGILTISSYFTKNKKLSLAAGIVSVLSGLLAEFTENTNTTYIDDGLLFLYDKSTKLIDFFKNYYNELFEDLDRYLSQNCSNNILNLQIQNATCNETDGKIEFTITLNKALEKELNLKVFTVEESATADDDFQDMTGDIITIPPNTTTYKYIIPVASDDVYEGKEQFGLFLTNADKYKGSDLKKSDVFAMATATILDFPQQECPKPQIPNFGFSFHTPTTKHISGGDNSYSGGGWGSSSIAYTPTTPSKKSLPYIPEYECYYDPELNSVLKVKLPSNLNTKNGNQTNNELNFTSSNNSNNTSTLRNFSKNLSTSTINSLNLINSKDLKQTDLNTTQTIKSSNNLDDNNQLSTLNLKESNTPSNNPNPKQTKLYFDMNSDGFKERMLNWLNDDEAILINDINNNGLVDSGLEIIGNNYNNTSSPDSFTLLKEFDTNKDGIIDSKDSHNLALWIDRNKDGITNKGELIYLKDINSPIKQIELNPLDTLLSGYDKNHDLKIDNKDAIFNYIYFKQNLDNSINLYIYGDDSAKSFLDFDTINHTILTNQGIKRVKNVSF